MHSITISYKTETSSQQNNNKIQIQTHQSSDNQLSSKPISPMYILDQILDRKKNNTVWDLIESLDMDIGIGPFSPFAPRPHVPGQAAIWFSIVARARATGPCNQQARISHPHLQMTNQQTINDLNSKYAKWRIRFHIPHKQSTPIDKTT